MSRRGKKYEPQNAPVSPTAGAEDDGRVVAPMNVPGMPWYRAEKSAPKNPGSEPFSARNLRRYIFSAVGTGLLIVLIIGLTGAGFIWFCINIWFR